MDLEKDQYNALVDAYTTLLVYGKAIEDTHPTLSAGMIRKARVLPEQFPDLKFAMILNEGDI